MRYIRHSTLLLPLLFLHHSTTVAQTLDTADDASMAESMDQAVQGLAKMRADYEKNSPAGFERWAKKHNFNISYNHPAKVPDQTGKAKKNDYTYLIQTKNSTSGCGGLVVALRRDMNDLGVSPCPTAITDSSVKGALVSYGGDAVKHNNTWTTQALGALVYNWQGFDPKNTAIQPLYVSTGLYASTSTILNSSSNFTKNNTEVFTYGLLGHVGFAPPLSGVLHNLYNNFGLSIGGVSNDISHKIAYNETLQYLPVSSDLGISQPIPISTLPLTIQYQPILIAQFDQAGQSNKESRLAFNNQYESVRIGPQIAVTLVPNPSQNTPYSFLQNLSASVTYHWAYETVGDKALPLFTANLSYALDPDKHFAVSASYQRGNDENTGIYLNQFLVGLTAKY